MENIPFTVLARAFPITGLWFGKLVLPSIQNLATLFAVSWAPVVSRLPNTFLQKTANVVIHVVT